MATPKDISKVAARLTKLLETAARLQEQQDAATAAGVPPDSPYPPKPRPIPEPPPVSEDAQELADDFARIISGQKPKRRRTPEEKRARRLAAEQKRFLRAFVKSGGRLREATRKSRIHHARHYEWLRNDPTYKQRFEVAREAAHEVARADARLATHVLESTAWRLAKVGRKLYYKGEPIIDPETGEQATEEYWPAVKSLLEANCPEKYRNVLQVTQQTAVDVQQIAGDVAAMAGMIQPPAEVIEAAVRARIIHEHEAGGGGNGNGHGGNGHASEDAGEQPGKETDQ